MFKMKTFFIVLSLILCLLGFKDASASDQDRTKNINCPHGWENIHNGCYKFPPTPDTWENASNKCKRENNGYLVTIQSEKEQIAFESHFKNNIQLETKFWAGFVWNASTRNWAWLDGPLYPKLTPWDNYQKSKKHANLCGIMEITSGKIKVSNDECRKTRQYICEFHIITNQSNFVMTTQDTNILGATISDPGEVTSQLGEIVGEGPIVGVSKANGQKTSVTGGLFSSMMTVLSTGDLNTSSQGGSSPEDNIAVKVPTTVDGPVPSTGSKIVKDIFKGIIIPKSEMTPETDVKPLTSITENYDSTPQPDRWTTLDFEERSNVNRTHEASSTRPSPTQPSWTSPETPQPTMVDWVRAYQEFEGCYIPGTGGSLRNAVVTARGIYKDDLTHCPEIEIGRISWPSTKAGKTANVSCAKGQGSATFRCSTKPVCWHDEPDIAGCTSKKLQDLLKETGVLETGVGASPPSIEETIKLASKLTQVSESESNTFEDVVITSRVLTALTQTIGSVGVKDVEVVIQNIAQTGSNLVSVNKSALWEGMSQEDRVRSASSLLVAIETAAVSMAERIDKPTVIITKNVNIEVEVRVVDTDSLLGEMQSLVYGSGHSENVFSIPVETLKSLSKGKLAKVVFITHYAMSELLGAFSTKPTTDTSTQPNVKKSNHTGDLNSEEEMAGRNGSSQDGNREEDMGPKIASRVLSASVGGERHSTFKLPKSVTFSMKHMEEVDAKFTRLCSFWDLRHNSKLGFWSQDGCRIVSTNKSHTTCECDHMTNFAILLDVHSMEMSELHQSVLRLVTIIGCFISCVSLLASWVTFQCFASLQGERNSIHKNLALTLLLAEILFIFGIDQAKHQIACSVIAGFLHFFFLAAFTWMFIEGLHIIFMLVQVFDASRSRLPYYYLAGYGAPFVVVGASCLFYYDGYGTDKYCWLTTDHYFIWAFAGPVAAILLVNAIFLTYAMSTVCRHSDYVFNSKDKSNTSGIRAWVQGALALEVLLGLTWTLGYFLINDDSMPLAYGFAILNSLQGLFIFIFHCVLNKKAQKEYRQVVRSVVKRSPSTATTQSTITKRTNNTNNSHELNNSPSNSHQKLNATNSHSLA